MLWVWFGIELLRFSRRNIHVFNSHSSPKMNASIFVLVLALFDLAPVQGVKKCEKIDTCRCLTDEGEISLWSLAEQTPPNRAR